MLGRDANTALHKSPLIELTGSDYAARQMISRHTVVVLPCWVVHAVWGVVP